MAGTHHFTALASNLAAATCLGALLGLGIYVNIKTVIVEGNSTPGYPVVNVNQTKWNIACTVVGTAVGILATLGSVQLDNFLTRKRIVSDQGVIALYLRPLTEWRSLLQIMQGQLHATRMFLGILIIASTLTSASTVALFGIHNIEVELTNPIPSFPLAAYNNTYFETSPDGATFAISPLDQIDYPLLEGFLYKAAYIGAAIAYNPDRFQPYNSEEWIPSSGQLGDTSYGSLNTGGIGLNLTSYFDYSGIPGPRFYLPSNYVFNQLHGIVFGTHINVVCLNSTANYAVNYTDYFENDLAVYTISDSNNVSFRVLQDTSLDSADSLILGAHLYGSSTKEDSDPLIAIVVPGFKGNVFICDCTYSGREYQASIAVPSRLSDLQVVEEVAQGPYIGHDVKWMLASTAASFLMKPGGGSVISAWTSTKWNLEGTNNTDTAAIMSALLSQTGEAQLSLMRQTVERANVDISMSKTDGSVVTMSVTIAKMGGGQAGWLSVYGLLLLGALLGVVQTFRRSEMTSLDVQNPVRVLELMLDNGTLDKRTRLKLDDKIEVLSS